MRREKTEERLLASARRLLAEQGADGVSLRRIALDCGVTPGAVYRHFASKQDLLERVTAAAFSGLEASLWRAMARYPTGSVERLAELGRVYVQYARDHPEDYQLMFSLTGERRPVESLPAYTVVKIVDECVADSIAAGTLIDGDPRMISLLLWARLHGLITLFRSFDFSTAYPELDSENGLDIAIAGTRSLLFEGLERK